MKRFIILMFLVVWSGVAATSNTYGQDANNEEWTGILKRNDERPENVTFRVKKSGESPHFKGMIYLDTFFEFKEHNMEGETLTFLWTPGDIDADCRLKKQRDGSYVGKCRYPDSDKFLGLVLRPPQTEE